MSVATITIKADESTYNFRYRPGTSDDEVINSIFKKREYDFARHPRGTELTRLYSKFVAMGRTPLIVDAGANIGAASIWFACSFPKSLVIAIEPELENFQLLNANSENTIIRPVHSALAAHTGHVNVVDPGEGAWGYRTKTAPPGDSQLPTIESTTVQHIYAEYSKNTAPFIVKIDIEGGEADVFSANTNWVDLTPVIIIELHDWLLPRKAVSRTFLQCVSSFDRDFVQIGENVFSIDNNLERFLSQ